MKVALLTNILPPYRTRLFEGIAAFAALEVLLCAVTEKNRQWSTGGNTGGFRVRVLRGPDITGKLESGDYRFIYIRPGIIAYLLFHRPDVMIIGDASVVSPAAAFLCRLLGVKYIWWSEMTEVPRRARGFIDRLRMASIRNASRVFVSGAMAERFIRDYAGRKEGITIVPDAVDNDRYFTLHERLLPRRRSLRKAHGYKSNDRVLLYVGQFIARKRVMETLRSFAVLRGMDRAFKLLLVGGGEQEAMYREYVRSHGLEDAVTIGQFMQAEELAEMYTIADALLLLSDYEPWGMVVNEAMCFGLPVAVSAHVGASMDLVRRDSGIIISDGDIGAPDLLARRLLDIRRLTGKRKDVSRVIKARVGAWNNELAAERIRDVLGSL